MVLGAAITAAGLLVFLAATTLSGGEYAASGTPEAESVQRAPVGVA